MGTFLVKNGLLIQQFKSNNGTIHQLQLVVSKTLHKEVLQDLHQGAVGGHMGEDKTLSRLKQDSTSQATGWTMGIDVGPSLTGHT